MNNLFYQNKSVLVTGANGFIGKNLVNVLSDAGAKLSVLNRREEICNPFLQQYIGDMTDGGFVESCLNKSNPEFIFHLASNKDRSSEFSSFKKCIDENLQGAINILSAAVNLKNLKSIIVLGSAEEYGNNKVPFHEAMRESPVSAYSFSKLCVTRLCQTIYNLYKLPVIIVRPALVYGPGQLEDMFLPSLILSLKKGKNFNMSEGVQTRDYIYISDLVDALLLCGQTNELYGEIINVGSGTSVKIREIAKLVEKMMMKSNMLNIGILPSRKGEILEYLVDTNKATKYLGWTSKTPLEVGLQKTIHYFMEHAG